jgi:hypothetical protein
VSDGALAAAARSGAEHAHGPWQSVWRCELSAALAPARDTAEYEPEGHLLGERGGGELLPYLKDRIDLGGGLEHARAGADGGVCIHRSVL